MSQIETSVAVVGVGGRAVDGVGFARAAGSANPTANTGVGSVRIAAAGCGQGIERAAVVAVVGERDRAGGAGGSGGDVFCTSRVGGGDDGEHPAGLRG